VWAFANDLFTEPQGKRLFPFIGVGSSLGAWLGAKAASEVVKGSDAYSLMLLGVVVLVACTALVYAVDRIESHRGDKDWNKAAEEPLGKQGGFQLVISDTYLRYIAILVILLNIVNSAGEYVLASIISEEAAKAVAADPSIKKGQFIGAFYGDFFAGVNLLGALLQMFAVSRIFRFIGVRGALFILPVIAFMGYSTLALVPLLGVVKIAKTLENATDYSIQNTARQALFLPTSREAKYKAKAAIDSFFMRFGDVISAGLVYLGTQQLKLEATQFAWLNAGLAIVWLAIVWQLGQMHRKRGF
jgi:AAA family ATP:ADP antiporter